MWAIAIAGDDDAAADSGAAVADGGFVDVVVVAAAVVAAVVAGDAWCSAEGQYNIAPLPDWTDWPQTSPRP